MATLPPSPFTTLPVQSAETLVVAPCPQAPVAAISGPFTSVAIVERPAEAPAVVSPGPLALDTTAECFIGEIFIGAAKLNDSEARFVLDEQAFMDAIDEPPLFLRQAV